VTPRLDLANYSNRGEGEGGRGGEKGGWEGERKRDTGMVLPAAIVTVPETRLCMLGIDGGGRTHRRQRGRKGGKGEEKRRGGGRPQMR